MMKDTVVKTSCGEIKGICRENCNTYFGIPYAKPPVGELRWREPEKQEPWTGLFVADKFGNMCFQNLPEEDQPITGRFKKEFYSNPDYIPPMSEDCLTLNIWTPHDSAGKKLPVAFWIHGGGFGGGYNSEMEFDGEAYCRKGVIFVSVNYRLGIFGFLAHPWLDAENERGISGNYGILDQIAALKWVYENIGAFGGDPHNITVFGQSAGSMSTQILVSSDLTGDMPAKAILQSGIACQKDVLFTPTLKEEEEIGEKFVKLTGVKNLDELRALTPEQLMYYKNQLDAETWEMGKGIVVVPNADGYVLKDKVGRIWEEGKMKAIPYMAGCVTDDLGTTPEESKAGQPGIILEECIQWSRKTEQAFGKPAYVYHFAHQLPGDDWGAFHTAEVWYMQGTLGRCWRPMTQDDYALSEEMVTYWTNFMKTGEPASTETEPWDPCKKDDLFVKIF